MKKTIITILILGILATVGSFGAKSAFLQLQANWAVQADTRNAGYKVRIHNQYYCLRTILVFDLRRVSPNGARADTFRVLLQVAEALSEKTFERVYLAYKGQHKFIVEGNYFKTLGQEYDFQNPTFTARTFPEHLFDLTGSQVFATWTGGLIGVVAEQMDDFNEFHELWYMDDIARSGF
jgi:hypothetical protein